MIEEVEGLFEGVDDMDIWKNASVRTLTPNLAHRRIDLTVYSTLLEIMLLLLDERCLRLDAETYEISI